MADMTKRFGGGDPNQHFTGIPRAGAVSPSVKVGDGGPPKDAGIGSMTPIRRDPHGATPAAPLSRDLREKMKDLTPELPAGIRAVDRRR